MKEWQCCLRFVFNAVTFENLIKVSLGLGGLFLSLVIRLSSMLNADLRLSSIRPTNHVTIIFMYKSNRAHANAFSLMCLIKNTNNKCMSRFLSC